MRLRVRALLRERGVTAYRLAKDSKGRISVPSAYRLARGDFRLISADVMDALCDVLKVEPGVLFERGGTAKKAGARRSR